MKWLLSIALVSNILFVFGQNTLTLEEAVRTALEQNHGIAISENQKEQASNIARPGNAGLLPIVTATDNTSLNNSNTNIELASNDVIQRDGAKSTANTASVQLTYVLFNGLSNINKLRWFNELENIADVNLRLTIENTLLTVIASYYEVARLTEISRVNRQAITISLDRYNRAHLRSDLGSGSRIDLLNSEVNLNADSVAYYRTTTELENAKRNLMVAISAEPRTDFLVDTTLVFQDGLNLPDLERNALEQNSFLAIARLNERATQYEVKVAKGSYYPEITLGGAYNYNTQANEASFTRSLQIDGFGMNAGIRWNLFDAQRRETVLRNAKLTLESNQEIVEDTRKQIIRDLENAYNLYINSIYVMNKEARNTKTNLLNFKRTEELFNLGQLNGTQFREAQLNLAQSNANYSNARYLAKIAEIQVIRVAGLLLGSVK